MDRHDTGCVEWDATVFFGIDSQQKICIHIFYISLNKFRMYTVMETFI